jgi:hypothetical protein
MVQCVDVQRIPIGYRDNALEELVGTGERNGRIDEAEAPAQPPDMGIHGQNSSTQGKHQDALRGLLANTRQ